MKKTCQYQAAYRALLNSGLFADDGIPGKLRLISDMKKYVYGGRLNPTRNSPETELLRKVSKKYNVSIRAGHAMYAPEQEFIIIRACNPA